MDALLVHPTDKKQSLWTVKMLKNAQIPFKKQKKECLEAKMFRLNQEGHYSDHELSLFFEIPKRYRIDPFEIIEDGDVFYADRRNVEQLEKDIEQAKKDREEGRILTFNNVDELWAHFEEK